MLVAGILTCPRCKNSRYTVRVGGVYRCDGCLRFSLIDEWENTQPLDGVESPRLLDGSYVPQDPTVVVEKREYEIEMAGLQEAIRNKIRALGFLV